MIPHRITFFEIGGSCTTILAAITANQEKLEWVLRCGASLTAILVGAATLWSIFLKKKQSHIE